MIKDVDLMEGGMIMKRRILKKLAKKLLTMPRELKGDTLDKEEIKKWAEIVAKVVPELKSDDIKEIIDKMANMIIPKIEPLIQTGEK